MFDRLGMTELVSDSNNLHIHRNNYTQAHTSAHTDTHTLSLYTFSAFQMRQTTGEI